jgi:hypothetical protein
MSRSWYEQVVHVNRIAPAAAAAILALAAPAAASPFAARTGRYRATARFTVAYAGSGRWGTSYHAEPSDGGGKHDTDTARDSSTQKWSETFSRPLVVRSCDCGRPTALTGARGSTSATGQIDHVHLDGLYTQLNASEHCTVRSVTPAGAALDPTVELAYVRRSRSLALTALDSVEEALTLLPVECPGQGDALDGLADNYFEPGLSFAPQWGSERWFTAATVEVPLATLHRTREVSIPLENTRIGTPPRDCGLPHNSWQHCRTGGAWTGTLTLRIAR